MENYSSSRDLAKVASSPKTSLTLALNISARRKVKPDWWDENIKELRRTSRRLFNNAGTTKLNSSWEDYKVSIQFYKKEIRSAKKNWKNFCETIESAAEATDIPLCQSTTILSIDKG